MANMTPTEMASAIGTDPKTLRKFLRSVTPERANKGGRWVLDSNQVDEFATQFASWKLGRSKVFTLPSE